MEISAFNASMRLPAMLLILMILMVGLGINGVSSASNKNAIRKKVTPPIKHGVDPQTTQYVMVKQSSKPYKREKAHCFAANRCFWKKLTCPSQCPKRVTTPYQTSDCFIDCSVKCQATCKHRKPNCQGYSSVCYDPRFVGGDGVMFYFHGSANEDFCLISDPYLHVNAHFIGIRPLGRTRDFTWVQALGILYKNHNFSIGARPNVSVWDETKDQLWMTYDGQEVPLLVAKAGEKWLSQSKEIEVERITDTNVVQVTIDDLMSLTLQVEPITKEDDRVHGYGIPPNDLFAHLNLQFNFLQLTTNVDGVLGQTYRPNFQNPVKQGVPMPIMGGEPRFQVSNLLSKDCLANQFLNDTMYNAIPNLLVEQVGTNCTSTSSSGGILCRR